MVVCKSTNCLSCIWLQMDRCAGTSKELCQTSSTAVVVKFYQEGHHWHRHITSTIMCTCCRWCLIIDTICINASIQLLPFLYQSGFWKRPKIHLNHCWVEIICRLWTVKKWTCEEGSHWWCLSQRFLSPAALYLTLVDRVVHCSALQISQIPRLTIQEGWGIQRNEN